jgi:glycosyltransferase involved in cell wall biosynthesis
VPGDFEISDRIDEGYALYSGQLEPWKGVDTLLEAWSTLDGPELRICGEGSAKMDLQDKARRKNLKNVHFMGHLPQDSLKPILANCAFLVAPSKCYENCPYSVMEAMAQGKPVIAAAVGGLPELVENNSTGFLFAPGDFESLSQQIRALSSDRLLRRRLGQNAKEKAFSEFSADRHYSSLMEVYESTLRKHVTPQ